MTTTTVSLDGVNIQVRAHESLLDACLRGAVQLPFSCQSGVCQTCLLVCTQGLIPSAAQRGLSEAQRSQGLLMACQCYPLETLHLTRPPSGHRTSPCVLRAWDRGQGFTYLRFETVRMRHCQPGQHLALMVNGKTLARIEIISSRADTLEALLRHPEAQTPVWPGDSGVVGLQFEVQGPDDTEPPVAAAPAHEVQAPEPDPGLWIELGGARVRAVLEDFYVLVYGSPQLASYFRQVTIDRSIDKQYSFLRQLMTGERVYFGDRPRNAHHWMVIPQALFDHRQHLMATTLQAHGLSPLQIARWTRLEQHFRSDIVKDCARPRQLDGADLPLEGYARERLSAATLCDHCGAEIDVGTEVLYHVRLGHVSCSDCALTATQHSCDDGLSHAKRA
jgi:ferredoxin/truncated hemoglobin YjbI